MSHILVIDDERIIRDGCLRILAKEGHDIQTATSGEEGLNLLRKNSFDLFLLDLKMPGLDGMEVLRQVKEGYPGLLVVVVTGYATIESAVEAMKAGAYDYIPKPFDPDQLRIVVHRALEKKALEQETQHLRQEQKKGLREIAGEQSRIKTIIHCMADGVLVNDPEGRVVLHNPAAIKMLKKICSPPPDQPLWIWIDQDYLKELVKSIRQICSAPGPAISQELQMEDGTLMAHTAPVLNEEGEILGAVTVLRDISVLKAMDQMKADFVSMVAHELRSPLAAVEQQLSVILGGILGELNERQGEMLGKAKEKTHALLTLIKNLLSLSKIEAGCVVQYKEEVQIAEVLEKAMETLIFEAERKKISINFSPSASLPLVIADRRNMEEVFINLLSNAIKYTEKGGWVKVHVYPEGGYLCIQFADNGCGISSDDLPHIFDKFYRAKNAQTRKITGSGLGLPIVKHIVEAHLGTVQVESQPGVGSKFRVYLPLEPRPEKGK